MRERARGGRLRTEHAEEPERVEVERVRKGEDVEARPREAVEHRHLEVAGERGEEPGELGVEIAHHLGIERERRSVGRLDVVGALDDDPRTRASTTTTRLSLSRMLRARLASLCATSPRTER